MTTTPPAPPRSGLRQRAGAVSEKVPTKWLVSGLVGLFLVASAAFGGLDAAGAPPVPEVAAGQSYTGEQLRITVDRATLIDAFPEQSIVPDEGNRLLVVIATVEDVWNEPALTISGQGAADNLRPVGVEGLDATSEPFSVAVIDDGSQYPELQPGVPIELAFIWQVEAGAITDGDEVRVDIYDKTYRAEGFLTYGDRFIDPVVAAYTTVELDDVGAGNDG